MGCGVAGLGRIRATRRANNAAECQAGETYFYCGPGPDQGSHTTIDGFNYCSQNGKCPVNAVYEGPCCYCGGCLAPELPQPPSAALLEQGHGESVIALRGTAQISKWRKHANFSG